MSLWFCLFVAKQVWLIQNVHLQINTPEMQENHVQIIITIKKDNILL